MLLLHFIFRGICPVIEKWHKLVIHLLAQIEFVQRIHRLKIVWRQLNNLLVGVCGQGGVIQTNVKNFRQSLPGGNFLGSTAGTLYLFPVKSNQFFPSFGVRQQPFQGIPCIPYFRVMRFNLIPDFYRALDVIEILLRQLGSLTQFNGFHRRRKFIGLNTLQQQIPEFSPVFSASEAAFKERDGFLIPWVVRHDHAHNLLYHIIVAHAPGVVRFLMQCGNPLIQRHVLRQLQRNGQRIQHRCFTDWRRNRCRRFGGKCSIRCFRMPVGRNG